MVRLMAHTEKSVDLFQDPREKGGQRFLMAQPTLIVMREVLENLHIWQRFMKRKVPYAPGAGWKLPIFDTAHPG